MVFRAQANAHDERNRLLELRIERVAEYVLALGVCAAIGLAIARVETSWIAQVLIASLVVAEVLGEIAKVVRSSTCPWKASSTIQTKRQPPIRAEAEARQHPVQSTPADRARARHPS